jgi:CcmD family protein
MLAGYLVIFVVLGSYLVSLILRWRKLKQDQRIFEELIKKE